MHPPTWYQIFLHPPCSPKNNTPPPHHHPLYPVLTRKMKYFSISGTKCTPFFAFSSTPETGSSQPQSERTFLARLQNISERLLYHKLKNVVIGRNWDHFFYPSELLACVQTYVTDVPPPSEKKSGEETTFLLPIFFWGRGTSVRLYTGYELIVVRKDKGQVVRSLQLTMQFSFVGEIS